MTSEQISLAKRAVASLHWKWLPGMLVRGKYPEYRRRIIDYGEMPVDIDDFEQGTDRSCSWTEVSDTLHGNYPGPWLPDFSDAATFGCLLSLASSLRDGISIEALVAALEPINDKD